MLNKIEKYLEMKRLNSDLNGLYKTCKQRIKLCEKEGMKISRTVKMAIKDMIYSIDNFKSYNLLRDNIYTITRYIPDTKSKYREIDESLYISLINIIANRINDENNRYMFDSNICEGVSIFDCLSNIEEISKQKLDLFVFKINDLIRILEQSDCKLKVQSSLILLNHINKINDKSLVSNFIAALTNINNEKKLEQIYILLSNNRYNFSNIVNLSISQFLEYIKIGQDERYDENLIQILKYLSPSHCINKIEPSNNNIIESILEINLKEYNNKNMEILIRLLNEDFIILDSWDLRDFIIETTLNMKFSNNYHKDFYVKFINDIVLSSNDLDDVNFQHRVVDLLSKIKSAELLEKIIDIYPFINKYNNNDEKYDIMASLSNNGNKINKLVISFKNNDINYDDENIEDLRSHIEERKNNDKNEKVWRMVENPSVSCDIKTSEENSKILTKTILK